MQAPRSLRIFRTVLSTPHSSRIRSFTRQQPGRVRPPCQPRARPWHKVWPPSVGLTGWQRPIASGVPKRQSEMRALQPAPTRAFRRRAAAPSVRGPLRRAQRRYRWRRPRQPRVPATHRLQRSKHRVRPRAATSSLRARRGRRARRECRPDGRAAADLARLRDPLYRPGRRRQTRSSSAARFFRRCKFASCSACELLLIALRTCVAGRCTACGTVPFACSAAERVSTIACARPACCHAERVDTSR